MFSLKITRSPRFLRGDFYLRSAGLLFLIMAFHPMFSQPKAEVFEQKKNFHSVKRGEVVILKYEIKNSGTTPLLLLDDEVSCSCTQVEYSKEPIAPGKGTTVVVTFNTQSVWGRQDRVVELKCNDPKGVIELRYKGHVSKT